MRARTSTQATIAHRLALVPVAPYDFELALAYLRSSPSAVLERISDAGVYTRALRLAGQPVLLRVWSEGTLTAPRLALEVRGAALSPAVLAAAEATIRDLFALDADSTGFRALGARDPVFGRLLARWPGLRPVRIAEPYEALLWAIIGQQIHVGFARKLKLALTEHCGEMLRLDGEAYPLLPAPRTVAALAPEALRGLQFSRQKAEYVRTVSTAIAAGELDLARLAARPHAEALATLTRYKGIGRWTAEYLLMRGLGAPDSLPAADLGLRAIIGRAYGLGRTATEAEVRARAEAWAGWRGWAAFAWWLALQLKLDPGELRPGDG
ncbi:MAG TPA: AlkA N-terminal domain-containing protein [Ktedonobacterales bacterium]